MPIARGCAALTITRATGNAQRGVKECPKTCALSRGATTNGLLGPGRSRTDFGPRPPHQTKTRSPEVLGRPFRDDLPRLGHNRNPVLSAVSGARGSKTGNLAGR